MKNILGGVEEAGRCYSLMDDMICWYDHGGTSVSGECGYSDNCKQCSCMAWDGVSSNFLNYSYEEKFDNCCFMFFNDKLSCSRKIYS